MLNAAVYFPRQRMHVQGVNMFKLANLFNWGSKFRSDSQGNVAVIFGLSLIPIISFVGAAVDYTRASAARSSMQAALDSTALMLSKDLTAGTIDPSQISTKATA